MQTMMTGGETNDDASDSSLGARTTAASATTTWGPLLWPGCHGKQSAAAKQNKTHRIKRVSRLLRARRSGGTEGRKEGREPSRDTRGQGYLGDGSSLDAQPGEEHHGRLGAVVDAAPAPAVRGGGGGVDHQRDGGVEHQHGVVGERHGSGAGTLGSRSFCGGGGVGRSGLVAESVEVGGGGGGKGEWVGDGVITGYRVEIVAW